MTEDDAKELLRIIKGIIYQKINDAEDDENYEEQFITLMTTEKMIREVLK